MPSVDLLQVSVFSVRPTQAPPTSSGGSTISRLCRWSLRGENSYSYMDFYHRGSSWEQRWSCWGHSATATANTLTTQYMVRFSHRTVQLPGTHRQTERRITEVIISVVESQMFIPQVPLLGCKHCSAAGPSTITIKAIKCQKICLKQGFLHSLYNEYSIMTKHFSELYYRYYQLFQLMINA